MARQSHLVRHDRKRSDLRRARRHHRPTVVNKWPAERVSLSPSGIDSLVRLNPIPGRDRRMDTGQRHDRAVSQQAAEGKHRKQAVECHLWDAQ